MSWPKQLDRFPLFSIERISKSVGDSDESWTAEGVVSNCPGVLQPRQSVWLASDVLNSTGIGAQITSYDSTTGRVVLDLWCAGDLKTGDRFPLLNYDYNPYQIAIVLDERRQWSKAKFVSRDAVATPGPDGFTCLQPVGGGGISRYFPPKEGESLPEDSGQVRKAAWDHEDCRLCQAKIGPHKEPQGYVDNFGHWVCCTCFEKYVATRDLSFVRLD